MTSEAEALKKIDSILRYYAGEYPFNSSQFQILAPMYRGAAGIDQINEMVQETFNSEPVVFQSERTVFRRLDKVMQTKNNYDREVFNGDLGVVEDGDTLKRILRVNFDGRRIEYAFDELEELTLAYAVSVHKSQGSEYDVVVLALLPSHASMLSRELLYTAITRARKRLLVISDETTVARAVRNSRPQARRTLLGSRLKEYFESSSATRTDAVD